MKKVILILILFIIGIILYARFIGIKNYKVVEHTIEIKNLSESFNGFKIAQFSDLLIGSTTSVADLEKIVDDINKMNADIIVFSGDLVNSNYNLNEDETEKIKNLLRSLDCTLYKYAVIGDSDAKNYKEIMTDSDFIVLDNQSTYIFYEDITPIKITGITNTNNIEKSLSVTDELETMYNIVITHYPDNIDEISKYDVDLVIAGHSLLGQIRLPFIGGIIRKDGAQKYIDNYYEVNSTKMFVSSGLGIDNKYYYRLFNRPEINLYRLKTK